MFILLNSFWTMNIPTENTLTELLVKWSKLSNKGITFVRSSKEKHFLSYADLYQSSYKLLAVLQSNNVNPGDEVVLQIDDNEVFLRLFWACILGGFIPVPISISTSDRHKDKVFNIWKLLDNPYLITTEKQVGSLKKFAEVNSKEQMFQDLEKRVFFWEELLNCNPVNSGTIHFANKKDLAYIQFSSGSTGNAKGVELTHQNLIANITSIAKAGKYTNDDCMVSWMPLTHDMGLIGFHLNPLLLGMNHCLIPTTLFVRRPAIWFDTATQHKATVICSPNFGYNYVLEHCIGKKQYDWDLSHVRILYNGAEPISLTLANRFLNEMKQYSLKANAMCPVYGLAEASLAVAISNLEEDVLSHNINRYLLKIGNPVISSNDENSIACVNLGKAITGVGLRITDGNNVEVAAGVLGHIQIQGENVTTGYYNNKAATKEVLSEGWLDTGDLGFIKDACLYVTGRHKNIIIVNGQNYYPYDLEKIAEEVDGISLNKIVVVGFFDHKIEQEVILSFVLYRSKNYEEFIKLADEVKAVVNTKIGVNINKILPVRDIPRTTSGKLKRVALKESYLNGEFEDVEGILAELRLSKSNSKSIVLPKDEIESKLYDIWRKVFKHDDFGVTDNFFKIGGNSLRGVQILTHISNVMDMDFSVDFLFENPTILKMKLALSNVEGKKNKIQQTKAKAWYPISEAQRNIFNAWKFDPKSTAYNIPFALKIKGETTIEDIEKALHQLYKRHSIINAGIDVVNEMFEIADKELLPLRVSQCQPDKQSSYLRSLVKPFDLKQERLYRHELVEVTTITKILFLDFHHIIADGESIRLFVTELSMLLSGKPLPLSTIDFKDYIAWRSSSILQEQELTQESYWKNKLNVEIPALELPVDFLRKSVKQHKGARKSWKLTKGLSDNLRTIAKENKTTLHSVMFTAYSWLLHKISSKEVICIGMPVSEKIASELQTVFGMFVNSLPVISKVSDDVTFSESVLLNRKEIIEVLKNQQYPVQKLHGFKGTRDASRNNFFDTMFLFQEGIDSELAVLQKLYFDPGYSKYDISLEVFNEDAIVFDIEYSTDLFASKTIANFQRYFNTILEQVCLNKEVTYSTLSLLDRKVTNELVYQFNETNESLLHDNFLSMFYEHVQKQPNSIALVHNEVTMSYIHLDTLSNTYANSLRGRGVKKGDTVCVILEKSTDLISCIIAIFKLGAIYIPIEVDTPNDRVEYIVKNAASNVLINGGNYRNANIASDLCIAIKDLKENTAEFHQELIASDDPAYIIYTSGTTGQPKGVVVPHKSLANYLHWAKEYYIGTDSNQTMALYSNISFDLTFTSIFLPLCSGNKVKIFSMNIKNMDIEKLFLDEQINIIKLTPSHLKMLLNNRINIAENSMLTSLIVGGENLDQKLAHSIHTMFDGKVAILNEYGPTEATIGCMIYKFNFEDKDTSVPIGKPIQNAQIYLLDKNLKPVPNGVEGDLYVSGEGLAKGYWKNEKLTNEKFFANPFITGKKMYNTGDVARRNHNNDLVFIRRSDNQVKINGFRIEIEEIEALFRKITTVIDCVVITQTISKRTFLVAFVVETSATHEKLSVIDYKNYLAESIPYYMIPEQIIRVDEIPLTSNGKADFKALNNILEEDIRTRTEEIGNDTEENKLLQVLKEVWKDVLKLDVISNEDSFYEIGGDSIKAAQIVSKLKEKGIGLSIKEILTYNTLVQISAFLSSVSVNRKDKKVIEKPLEGERMKTPIEDWFFKQQFENSGFYNQSVFLKFNEKIDKLLLEKTLAELIRYHDNLRINVKGSTLFYNDEHIKREVSINEYQIEDTNQDVLDDLLVSIKKGFDLSSSLLIKAAIVKNIKDNSERLLITAHHLLVDGVSWRIILEDLYSIYKSLVSDNDIDIPNKSASLKKWTEQSTLSYDKDALSKEVDFWKSKQTKAFLFPEKFDNESNQTLKGDYHFGKIDEELSHLFVDLTQGKNAFNVDKQIILFLSWALAIKEVVCCDTLTLQVESNGRNGLDIDVSRTVGWFTLFYPLTLNLLGKDIATLLLEIKEAIREVPNQGLGYMLLNQKGILEDPSFTFPEVRFNYLGEFSEEMNNDVFELATLENGIEFSKENKVTAKIEINIVIVNNQVNYRIINSQLIENHVISDLLVNFENQLRQILMCINNTEEVYYSPSDFSSATLDIDDLNTLFE